MNNQKSYYKSLILTLIGLNLCVLGFILSIIFGTILNNNILIAILMLCSFIGFILLIIDDNVNAIIGSVNKGKLTIYYKYKLYGVPNNSKEEFFVSAKELYSNKLIKLYEIDKGVFTTVINNKELTFDLRGWHNKSYCLYEYFMTVIQLDLSKNNKVQLLKNNYVNINNNIKLIVFFKNKKIKEIFLITKGKTNLSFTFKHRNKVKLQITSRKKISLCDLYYFNN